MLISSKTSKSTDSENEQQGSFPVLVESSALMFTILHRDADTCGLNKFYPDVYRVRVDGNKEANPISYAMSSGFTRHMCADLREVSGMPSLGYDM